MRNGLLGLMANQGGVFLRRQALTRGYTPREFERLTRSDGPFARVRYGAYTTHHQWAGLDEVDRWRLRDRAAILACNDQTVLSHSAAARAHGLPTYDVDDRLVHVTRVGESRKSRIQSGIKHHRAAVSPEEIVELHGAPTTSALRTVLDVSREFGFRSGLVTADGALRMGLSQPALLAAAATLTSTPHLPVIRAVAQQADGRAQTPIETLARVLLVNMGITDLELQFRIDFPGGGHAEVDLYSPGLRHVFEADGRLKYKPQVDRYGNPMSADDVIWMEKKREDKVRGQALGVSRIYWPDTLEANFAAASKRLWSEINAQSGRLLA